MFQRGVGGEKRAVSARVITLLTHQFNQSGYGKGAPLGVCVIYVEPNVGRSVGARHPGEGRRRGMGELLIHTEAMAYFSNP